MNNSINNTIMNNQKIRKYQFIIGVIKSLQMNPVEFEQNLIKGAVYETILYNWSVNLFQEGKDINEAIRIILEKRIQIIYSINGGFTSEGNIINNRNCQKVLAKLKDQPTYSNLRENEKQKVKSKINALVQTRLWSIAEIVDLTHEIIKNTINSSNTNNKIITKDTNQSENKNSKVITEFKNLLTPKTTSNETTLQSS